MLRRAVSLALLVSCALALGQEGGLIKDLEAEFSKKLTLTRPLRLQLFKGDVNANAGDKSHLEAIDMAAKEVTYPLHWQGRSFRPGRTDQARLIKDTVDEAEARLRQLNRNKEPSTVASMQSLYAKALMTRARDVILEGPPIASVNAARILALITYRAPGTSTKDWIEDLKPRLAGDGAEQLLSICADLIAADPKKLNDGVRIYLLRVAHDVLALPDQKPALVKPETVDRVIAAASGVVTRKVMFPKATPRGEVEGFKMLRAEALRVVARAPEPSSGKERPALILARIAANDVSVEPAPRVEELLESAIGLCRLVAGSKQADFNSDYAAQQVARAVAQIGDESNREQNFEAKGLSRVRPWKMDAGRLLDGLEMLKGSKDAYVVEVIRQTRPVLLEMEAGRTAPSANLGTWVNGETKPANMSLFKGGDPSEVKPRARPDE